jgi:hypothetical protein
MAKISRDDCRNTLLSKLPTDQFESPQRYLQPIELEVPRGIYEPNQPIEHVYFPESGMISVVSVMEDGRSIEVGMIGREGVAGGTLLLHANQVPYCYFTQMSGHAQRRTIFIPYSFRN